jgi:dihydrofolate reductase
MATRKLKLQVQMTVDGFVAGPDGQLDWMTRDLDEGAIGRIVQITDSSDTILLGRKMTDGFIKYWETVQPESPEYIFARRMVDTPKIVFSKTLKRVEGKNVRVEGGDLVQAVNKLKAERGKDIVVYGGATFVSALIENDLIDEFNIFVNPVSIGRGMRIFHDRKPLRVVSSTAYSSGVVVNTYQSVR